MPRPQRPQRIATRTAPAGLTLPVPRHVKVTSTGLGFATTLLGVVYLLAPPSRTAPLSSTTMARMEVPLGLVMVTLGLVVVGSVLLGRARSSMHGITAVTHLVYTVALVLTFLQAEPPLPTVPSVLSVFAFVAHGGACIDYWKRGWR